jgi:hypothetical protein
MSKPRLISPNIGNIGDLCAFSNTSRAVRFTEAHFPIHVHREGLLIDDLQPETPGHREAKGCWKLLKLRVVAEMVVRKSQAPKKISLLSLWFFQSIVVPGHPQPGLDDGALRLSQCQGKPIGFQTPASRLRSTAATLYQNRVDEQELCSLILNFALNW